MILLFGHLSTQFWLCNILWKQACENLSALRQFAGRRSDAGGSQVGQRQHKNLKKNIESLVREAGCIYYQQATVWHIQHQWESIGLLAIAANN